MTRFSHLTAMALLLAVATVQPAPVAAKPDRAQADAGEAVSSGRVLPLKQIIADVQSRAPYRDMTYLGGPQFDSEQLRYALRFMDGSQVVIVHVDARTGRILGVTR